MRSALALVLLTTGSALAETASAEQGFPGFGSISDGMPTEPGHVTVAARFADEDGQSSLAPSFAFTPARSGFFSESLFTISPGTIAFDATMSAAGPTFAWQQRWFAADGLPSVATVLAASATFDEVGASGMLVIAQSFGQSVVYASTWIQSDRIVGGSGGLKVPLFDGVSMGTSVRRDTTGETAFEIASVVEVGGGLTMSPGIVFVLHGALSTGVNVGWTL